MAFSEVTAQTNTREIVDIVRDAQGGLLPGATVVIEHRATGARIQQITVFQS